MIELFRKEIKKNHRQRMKTRLGARTYQKKPRREVQTAPEHEKVFGVQELMQHFWSTKWHIWSAKQHSRRAKFSPFGLWPNDLRVMIRHTLFDLFTKGCIQIHILIIHAYFLESSSLYK